MWFSYSKLKTKFASALIHFESDCNVRSIDFLEEFIIVATVLIVAEVVGIDAIDDNGDDNELLVCLIMAASIPRKSSGPA